MPKRLPRRDFLATPPLVVASTMIGLASGAETTLAVEPQLDPVPRSLPEENSIDVRPYQLMCVVCRIGEGRTEDLGDVRLTEILRTVRHDPKTLIRLRLNTSSIYRCQNPGPAEDTPEGELFNGKRDLDITQKLGLVPGDARPAIDMFERLLTSVTTAKGVCGYERVSGPNWQGCSQAFSGHYENGCARGVAGIILPRDAQEKADVKRVSASAIYQAKTLMIRPHHLMCMSCFYGGRMDALGPIEEDNLFEVIDVIQKDPDIPVTLVRGTCMICPPCSHFETTTRLCLGGRSMALRDEKKDLDVLQKLGLAYGDTLPARELFALLYERILSTREICGYGDGQARAPEWSICGDPEGNATYRKARAAMLGIGS